MNFAAPSKTKIVFTSLEEDVPQSNLNSHDYSRQNIVGMWSNKRDNNFRNQFKAVQPAVCCCKSPLILSFLAREMVLLLLYNCQHLDERHIHAIVLECNASAFVKYREQRSATGFQDLLKNFHIFEISWRAKGMMF